MFYIIVFSLLAVLLVVAGVTAMNRNKAEMRSEDPHHPSDKARAARKAKRTQSKQARRKR
jgi:nitrate reductase cytochrome c-type subunit